MEVDRLFNSLVAFLKARSGEVSRHSNFHRLYPNGNKSNSNLSSLGEDAVTPLTMIGHSQIWLMKKKGHLLSGGYCQLYWAVIELSLMRQMMNQAYQYICIYFR
jgi:hypothetical protein